MGSLENLVSSEQGHLLFGVGAKVKKLAARTDVNLLASLVS